MDNWVYIHGERLDRGYVEMMLASLLSREFARIRWSRRDALVAIDGSRATPYSGQQYDPSMYKIKQGFWDHDHCLVCGWVLTDTQGEAHAWGYYNGNDWLCEECYNSFLAGQNP